MGVYLFCICAFPFLQLEQGITVIISSFMSTDFLVGIGLYVAHLFSLKRSEEICRDLENKPREVEPGIMLFLKREYLQFQVYFHFC